VAVPPVGRDDFVPRSDVDCLLPLLRFFRIIGVSFSYWSAL
jgi:hypothetical protein